MTKFSKTTRSLLFVALCLPTAALAQGTDDQRGACMGDAFRLCGSAIPDETAIEACLERNLPDLTPTCRAQFDTPAPTPVPATPARRPPVAPRRS